jgi:hypothetical protein
MKHLFLYLCIFGIGFISLNDSLTRSTEIHCLNNIQAACEELARR